MHERLVAEYFINPEPCTYKAEMEKITIASDKILGKNKKSRFKSPEGVTEIICGGDLEESGASIRKKL